MLAIYSIFFTPVQGIEYTLLEPIPLDSDLNSVSEKADTSTFIEGMFRLIIALAGGLAVIMIMYGGFLYLTTESFSGKGEAKHTIENALWGFLLAISAWLILNTINSKLTTLDISLTPQTVAEQPTGGTGGGPSGGGAPTGGLQPSTLSALDGLRQECNCTVQITSTTGGTHNTNSLHYQGLAVDIGDDQALTKYLTGQTTDPQACSIYVKTLNGVNSRFLWEPTGATCGGAVASTGDHWHMSVVQ